MTDQTEIITHYNGASPLKIILNDNQAVIYDKNDKVIQFEYDKIFIGKSNVCRTSFWGSGHGEEWDGNSVLFRLSENRYLFACEHVYEFTSLFNIVQFESPMGNNAVPYPYAVDEYYNHYLMLNKVIVNDTSRSFQIDPYEWYYKSHYLSLHSGRGINENPFKNIKWLCCVDNGSRERHNSWFHYENDYEEYYNRLVDNENMHLEIETIDNKFYKLSKEKFCELLEEFKKHRIIIPFKNVKQIH